MRRWLGCLVLLGACADARAAMFGLEPLEAPELVLGPLELHPYAGLAESYDSDIYLQPGAAGSWIHSAQAGALGEAQLGRRQRLQASYDAEYRAYSRDPSINNTVNQAASLSDTYQGPRGLSARARDEYLNTVDPATSELTQRTRRWNNRATAEAAYAPQGGRLYAGLDAGQTVDKYVASSFFAAELNRYTQLFGAKLGWLVAPKTRVYAAYHRQLIHYTDHPGQPTKNSKANLVDLGVEGRLAATLTGHAQAGLEDRAYDDEAVPGSGRGARYWTVGTQLEYQPVPRTRAELSLRRFLQESTFGVNRFYVASAARLDVSRRLPWKTTVGVSGEVEQDRYPETEPTDSGSVNRVDDLYETGVRAEYEPRERMRIGIETLYRSRISRDLADFDYHDQITTVWVQITF